MNAHMKIQQKRRETLETYIEKLILLLDTLDGDENLEDGGDAEPSIGNQGEYIGGTLFYDLEYDTADAEPNLGWSEHESLHNCNPHPGMDEFGPVSESLKFDGDGYHIARKLLRDTVRDQRKLAKALDTTRVSPGYGRYVS